MHTRESIKTGGIFINKIMRHYFRAVLFLALSLSCFACFAEGVNDRVPVILNPIDFGAKGDGRTDDTEAFNKLSAEIAKREYPVHIYIPSGVFMVNPLETPIRKIGPDMFRQPCLIWLCKDYSKVTCDGQIKIIKGVNYKKGLEKGQERYWSVVLIRGSHCTIDGLKFSGNGTGTYRGWNPNEPNVRWSGVTAFGQFVGKNKIYDIGNKVINCSITEGGGQAITFQYQKKGIIANNVVCDSSGLAFSKCDNCIMSENISTHSHDAPYCIDGGKNIVVANNISRDTTNGSGIDIVGSSNCVITGNLIEKSAAWGMLIAYSSHQKTGAQNILVSNNIFIENCQSKDTPYNGEICVGRPWGDTPQSAVGILISNNKFTIDGTHGSDNGSFVSTTFGADNIQIVNNVVNGKINTRSSILTIWQPTANLTISGNSWNGKKNAIIDVRATVAGKYLVAGNSGMREIKSKDETAFNYRKSSRDWRLRSLDELKGFDLKSMNFPNDAKGVISGKFTTNLKKKTGSLYPTRACIVVDSEKITVLFDCEDYDMSKLKNSFSKRDSKLWFDDTIELFLNVNTANPEYYHFIVNPNGAIFDQICSKGEVGNRTDWNGVGVEVQTKINKNGWTAAIAIPLVNFSNISKKWTFNLARGVHGGEEYSSSAGIIGGFHQPEYFDSLTNIPVSPSSHALSAEILDPGMRVFGTNLLKLRLKNSSKSPRTIETLIKVKSPPDTEKYINNKLITIAPKSELVVDRNYILKTLGINELIISLQENGRCVFTTSKSINCRASTAKGKKGKTLKMFSKNGFMIVDGKPFFPIGLYRMPPSLFKNMAQIGFNCTEVTEYHRNPDKIQHRLLAAEGSGIKILPQYDYAGRRFLPERLKKVVERFKDTKDLLAWYLADEPQNYGITPENAVDLYDAIKLADPTRPVVIVHSVPSLYDDYAPACDIMLVDMYPVPSKPLTDVSDAIENARKESGGKPVWAVLQGSGNLKAGKRPPAPAEERCMTYLAITHEAKGIIWFAYTSEEMRGCVKDKLPSLWKEIKKLAGELKLLSPILLNGKKVEGLEIDHPSLHYLCLEHDGNLNLFVVNPSNKVITSTVRLPKKYNIRNTMDIIFENRKKEVRNSQFKDRFNPFDVHIYKIRVKSK